ncbi:hypothetical protein SAMN05444354_103435 [Stigmatella aurantiaca]|uniref:Uncharacterized protein n=1 Tax=Stigmatella aurantiaca TaxID=41 RepID=A0A1H7M6B9_STIAU|nr:hypothetical protein SAMN05444354_103435 [Stigmatella aurantiaca]
MIFCVNTLLMIPMVTSDWARVAMMIPNAFMPMSASKTTAPANHVNHL